MKIENINLTNTLGEKINPLQDETVLLLRRIVKMLESSAVVDGKMRQRIITDSTSGVYGTYNLTAAGTNFPTNSAPITSSTVSYVATWNGPIDPRWTNVEQARITYNTNIRNKLKFT